MAATQKRLRLSCAHIFYRLENGLKMVVLVLPLSVDDVLARMPA
jgi:hypothetical protein